MVCNAINKDYNFGMSAAFEEEHTRIRTELAGSSTIEEVLNCDAEVDIVARALASRTTILEKKLHQLQGAIVFKSLGIDGIKALDQVTVPDELA
jgi:hypothetical protein